MPTVTSEAGSVLVVAAERFELKYVRPQGQDWILTANGPGPHLAGEAVDRISCRVSAVVSTGLCGALVDELAVGDIVIATEVNGIPVDTPVRTAGRYMRGPIASIDHVAQTVSEKASLRSTGAIAVEMEAAAVLERARQLGVPFYCIRAVSDTAKEAFVLDLNAARDVAGRFSAPRIVAQALRRPLAGVPELLRLQRNAAVAVRALGEFIGNCSF